MQMGVDMRGPLFPKEQVPVSTPIPREVGTPFRWHDGFLSLATPHKVEARVRQRACQRRSRHQAIQGIARSPARRSTRLWRD
jgi:hypothetical protein